MPDAYWAIPVRKTNVEPPDSRTLLAVSLWSLHHVKFPVLGCDNSYTCEEKFPKGENQFGIFLSDGSKLSGQADTHEDDGIIS